MDNWQNPKPPDTHKPYESRLKKLERTLCEHSDDLDSHKIFRKNTETTLGELSEQLQEMKHAEFKRKIKRRERRKLWKICAITSPIYLAILIEFFEMFKQWVT